MTADVRAITIRRPWSTCIAATQPGAKRVENRGAGTSHRGILLIHEGKTVDVDAFADRRVADLLTPHRDAHKQPGAGAVIAVAELVDVHRRTGRGCCAPWGEDWYASPKSVGQAVHLLLDNVRRLPKPVPCRGALGLWTPPEDVTAQALSQVAGQVAR